MIRIIRNSVIAINVLFVCGILGSLELEKITLSRALDYILLSVIFCAAVIAFEAASKFFGALLVVYARKRRMRDTNRKQISKKQSDSSSRRIMTA